MNELAGKIAIVTGAGVGIGRASVVEFVAEGAAVVAVDLDGAALEETRALAGGDVITVTADVSDPAGVESYVRAAHDAHGRVDVLFNNAGIFLLRRADETTVEEFDRIMSVNVRSVFLGMQAVFGEMIERRAGAIVNNASINGLIAPSGTIAYTASKHAVIGLTKAAATDVGPFGVRVNAICPALARTPMLASLANEEQATQTALRHIPLQRTADPAEPARVACFLASDRASFVTGEAVLVDGGMVNCRPR